MQHYTKVLTIAFLTVFSILATLLPKANHASAAYPPLSAADGEPATAAHLVHLENGMVEIALQVLAPGNSLEAVRIDNLGGVSSLWRSDGKDGAAPLSVSRGGTNLSSGAQAMNLALGDAEALFSLSLKDNGAFAGKGTDFRITVFFTGGGRAMYALDAGSFPATAFAQAGQGTKTPAVSAGQPAATSAQDLAPDQTAAERIAALEEQNRRLLELTQKKTEGGTETPATAAKPDSPAPSAMTTQPEPPAAKLQEAQTQDAKPTPEAPRQQYRPGWLARIISMPADYKITDPLPPLEIGNFVATKSNYASNEYIKIIEGAFGVKNILWKGEAFLHAAEAGNYIFSVTAKAEGSSWSVPLRAIYVEGTQVAAAEADLLRRGREDTLMGATHLEPGLYKVEFRVAHEPSEYRSMFTDYSYYSYSFTLQIKRPSDSQMLPAHQVLLLPVPSVGGR